MKVLLIFPPRWVPNRPYLSLPSLSAYLKSNGVNVIQKDFNIEAYDLLMSESYLKSLGERLQDQFNNLDSKDRLLSGIEQEYYRDVYNAKSSVNYIAEKIEDAKRVFRSKDFYDLNALTNARKILRDAQSIISISCFPSGQDLVLPIYDYIERSLEDIKKITQNRIENPYLELYDKHLIPFILKEDPDIIGISIPAETQLVPALSLSRLIKEYNKKAHIVVGGYVVTLLSDTLMKYEDLFTTFFDSAVLYEGERPLLKLVDNISQGLTLEDVPNLVYFDKGKIRANEILPSEDINLLPTPCFDGLPFDLYFNPELALPIISSRGCYWGKCAFCTHNVPYRWRYQSRDAKKVIDDMQELSRKHGVVHFAFSDEGISPSSMSELSDEIIKRGMDVRCSTSLRLERQFTPELCDRMYKAGFRLLFLGLESGCNRVLKHMNKGTTKETAREVCKNLYDAGIWNHLSSFLGFPTESRDEAQETIDFLSSNSNIICSYNLNNFTLAKGAPVMECPEKYGISDMNVGTHTDFFLEYGYTVSSGLTSSESYELSSVYRDKIDREYKTRKFIKKLDYEDLLLYLSHFEESDPSLSSLRIADKTKTISDNKFTWESIPIIKRNLVFDSLRFNILNIWHNIANNKNITAFPNATRVLFDPISTKFCPATPLIIEIIALCDGRRNVRQIAHELSKKYDAPKHRIEKDCIPFLEVLADTQNPSESDK